MSGSVATMRWLGRVATLAVLGVLVLVGCSSAETKPTDSSTSVVVSRSTASAPDSAVLTTAPPSSASTVVVTTASTVAAPSTTVTSTSESTSAGSEAASVDPGSDESAVRAAIEAFAQSWRDCMRALPHCDTSLLATTRDGPQLALSTSTAQSSIDAGYEARNVDDFQVSTLAVSVSDDARAATATVCFADGVVLVSPTTNADEVVNDEFTSTKGTVVLLLGADGLWRVSVSTVEASASGRENDLCA